MASTLTLIASALALFVCILSPASASRTFLSSRSCSGRMRFKVVFNIAWTRERFSARTVPENAMISPLTAATHISRYTPFADFGMATSQVESVAEGGDNMPLVRLLRSLNEQVGDVQFLTKPGPALGSTSIVVTADAGKSYTQLSAITMLAPTPDWVTFVNNVPLCVRGRWVKKVVGPLYGFDAGTEMTPGVNQRPQQNIYRLSSPAYPRYDNRAVGIYTITAINA